MILDYLNKFQYFLRLQGVLIGFKLKVQNEAIKIQLPYWHLADDTLVSGLAAGSGFMEIYFDPCRWHICINNHASDIGQYYDILC